MAGPTVKEILLKWGIDNTNWKNAIKELSSLLDKANKEADKAADKAAKKLETQKQKLKEYIADQKSETAEIEKQIAKLSVKAATAKTAKVEASAKLAVEKAATAEADKQIASQKQLQAIQKTLQAEVNTKLMQEKLVTAEINKQTASLRQQALQQRMARPPGGGRGGAAGGGAGGAGRFLAGLFGGGLFGNVTAAVASAEALGTAVKELGLKINELAKETGPLQQVKEQFEKLAPARGVDPTEFIERMRGATKGLVTDINLYRNANTFLQSSVRASQEDVIRLTQATVGLARAQGRDATSAVQALNRFFLTGRAFTLAYATGIQRAQLMVGGLGRGTDQTITSQKQFQQALEAITEQYKMVGEPALTYAEALTKLQTSVHNVIEEFMMGVTQSDGFKGILDLISKMADSIESFADKASKIGAVIGNLAPAGLEVAIANFEALRDILTSVWELVTYVSKTFKEFVSLFSTSAGNDLEDRLTSVTGIFTTLGEAITMVTAGTRELLNVFRLLVKASNPFSDMGKALDEFKAKEQEIAEDMDRHLTKLEQIRTGHAASQADYRIKFAAPAQIFTAEQEEAAERKIAKVKEQIALQTSKILLEQTQMRIKNEEELVQAQYDQGLLTFKEYLDKKADLDRQDHEAKMLQLKQEFDAKQEFNEIESRETRELAAAKKEQVEENAALQLADIAKQRVDIGMKVREAVAKGPGQGGLSAAEGKKTLDDLNKQYTALEGLIERSKQAGLRAAGAETAEADAQRILTHKQYLADMAKEDNVYAQKQRQLTEQDIQQRVAARQKLVELEAKIIQDGLKREQELLESSFKEGMVSAQEYLDGRVELVNAEYNVTADAAQKKLEQNKDSLTAEADFDKAMADAEAKRQQELTKLANDEWDIRVRAAESAANRISSILEGQLRTQEEMQKLDPWTDRTEQQSTLQQLISLEQKRLGLQTQQLRAMEEEGLRGSETWTREAAAVSATEQKLLQLNIQLQKSKDYSNALAGTARNLATAAGMFPKGGERTAAGFDKFAETVTKLSQLWEDYKEQQIARKTGKAMPKPIRTPEEAFASLAKAGDQVAGKLVDAVNKSNQAMDAWTEKSKQTQDQLSASLKALNDELEKQKEIQNQQLESTAKAIDSTNKFATALDRATSRVMGPMPGPSVTKPGFYAGALSGPRTATSPQGTLTDSDMQNLTASVLSGGSGMGDSAFPALGAASADAAKSITDMSNAAKNATQGQGGKSGLFSIFDDLKEHVTDIFQGLTSKDAGKFGQGATGMMGMVSGVAGGVGGMMSAAKGTGGPFQAGMTGMASGLQLGMMFGGPIGGVIGAGAGLITGVFSGKAEQRAEKLAKKIVAMFNAVQTEIQNGTQTLAAGVQLQIKNIENAVSSLSGKKGGRDQLKNILPQMEQQLQQLQQQQESVIKTFDQQLSVLNAPEAYQETLGQVQQIINTYQQYIQAGGNVANANEYLRQSFVNLVQNGMNELNQDEQDAIQNALNYNDLLLQRQELIQSTNQQIQDIMSQGVAARQMPEGVSKAQQIEQVERGAQQQLDQMNAEISVSQYKLNTEQKIFGLATTRIGLENQLVALQDQSANLQFKQIEALGSMVGSFKTQLPTSMQSALQQLGLGAGYVSPGTEAGLIPTPPVKTGIADIDLQNQLQYQQALAAYQLSMNQPIGYISTTGPLPTTTTVPVSIGTAPTTNMPVGSTWLKAGQASPASLASATDLASAAASAAAVQQQNQIFLGSTPGALGTSSLTVNDQQVDTVSTPQGNALLVTMGTVTSGPGTTQTVGLVGTLQSVIQQATQTMSSLTGVATALLPKPTSVSVSTMSPAAIAPITTSTWTKPIGTLPTMTPGISTVDKAMTAVATSVSSQTATSQARLSVENQINQLSNTRVAQETQLVNLKMQEIAADMQRINAHSQLLTAYKSSGASAPMTLEDLFQQTYQARSRQGFGRFYGETANAPT